MAEVLWIRGEWQEGWKEPREALAGHGRKYGSYLHELESHCRVISRTVLWPSLCVSRSLLGYIKHR